MTGKGPEAPFDGLRVKVRAAFGENEKALELGVTVQSC